jgi:hypothetical protein
MINKFSTKKKRKEKFNYYTIFYDTFINNFDDKTIKIIYSFLKYEEIILISEINKKWFKNSENITWEDEFKKKKNISTFNKEVKKGIYFNSGNIEKETYFNYRKKFKIRILCFIKIIDTLIDFIRKLDCLEKEDIDLEYFKEMIFYDTIYNKNEFLHSLKNLILNIYENGIFNEYWHENYILYNFELLNVYFEVKIYKSKKTIIKTFFEKENFGEEEEITFLNKKFQKLDI